MYTPCKFRFRTGQILQSSEYTIEQFRLCLTCKSFDTAWEDYTCKHEDGFNCMTGKAKHRECKAINRIPIMTITIHRGEGPTEDCTTTVHTSFESAEQRLVKSARTAPKGGGYDKHDVTLEWADGSKYGLRVDVKNIDDEYPNLVRYVVRELEFYAGRYKPERLTEAQYQAIRGRVEQRVLDLMKHILDDCAIG
jgi:hypothetical protein